MTLTMAAHITFPASHGRAELNIWRVSAVRVESSFKEFTGKAEITLPRRVKNFNDFRYADIFKAGDPVIIRLGYGAGELPVEFEGYLCDISEGVPVILKCEDEMYKLKRGSVSVSAPSIKLKDLLKKIAPAYEVACPDMQLGAVRWANKAPIEILEELKKDWCIYTYFVGKTLHAFDGYSAKDDTPPVKIFLEKNAVSESLNRKNADENYQVKITSAKIKIAGKKKGTFTVKVEHGEAGGSKLEIKGVNWTKAEMEIRAKRLYEIHKTQGFDGSVTLFGVPRITSGMRIYLKSEFYKNMEGTFFIEKVEKKFDENGYRQDVTLGDQAI